MDDVLVFRVGQDLKQLIVRQEVEPREGASLGLQEVLQLLCDVVDVSILQLEVIHKFSRTSDDISGFCKFLDLLHELLEEFVDSVKHVGLLRKSFLDFRRLEDVFQIHPRLLEGDPLFDASV